MAILQLRSKRKSTGGRYKRPQVKRLSRLGGLPVLTKIAALRRKAMRVPGANRKDKILFTDKANVYDSKTKKHSVVEIKNTLENPANRHFVRRNIITKGSVIETSAGKAKVTSRPGQNGYVDAILLE